MTRALFTTCGRNILPAPKRSPTTFMPSISGPSMTSQRTVRTSMRASSVSATTKSSMPFTSACVKPLRDRQACAIRDPAPRAAWPAVTLEARRDASMQPVRSRRHGDSAPRLRHASRSSGSDVVVDRQLAGVDDAHVHAVVDGVVQEHRVHRLAHRIVAAERERHVARRRRSPWMSGSFSLMSRRGVDEGLAVAVVLLHARGDGEDIRVEDDVLGREADLFSVSTL